MILWHIPIKFRWKQSEDSALMPLFLSGMNRRIAASLLYLFSPIYIYQIARAAGLESRLAIIGLAFYYLLFLVIKLFTLIISEDLSQRIGFKHTILLSAIPFFFFLPTIIYARQQPILLLFSSVLWGIHAGLFWWGYHGYFIKVGKKDHFGRSIAAAGLLETVASVLTPISGAIVVNFLGFTALFVLSAAFMLASLFLLGKDHEKKQRRDVRFREVLRLIRIHKSISLAYIGSSGEGVIYTIIWPLFLFLSFSEVLELGWIVSLASLLAAILALLIGKWVDKQGERRVVSVGIPLMSASWLFRMLPRSISAFVSGDSIRNFGERMVTLPLNALTYKKALEAESAKAILFRETALMIGSFSSLLIFGLWVYFGGSLRSSFILAAIFALMPLVAVYKHRLTNQNG
jgi:MFS family permease